MPVNISAGKTRIRNVPELLKIDPVQLSELLNRSPYRISVDRQNLVITPDYLKEPVISDNGTRSVKVSVKNSGNREKQVDIRISGLPEGAVLSGMPGGPFRLEPGAARDLELNIGFQKVMPVNRMTFVVSSENDKVEIPFVLIGAQNPGVKFIDNSPGYDIAVYYFPNYHNNDSRNEIRYGKGWSEWELVKNAQPRFDGQKQPKIPVWGYTSESDPGVMEMKINAASKSGIDVFIYDWYYYNDGPFLEKGLEQGFMKVENNNKVRFALMWANHDWVDLFPRNPEKGSPALFYPGTITPATFDRMTDYIISNYFSQPTYWKIDGCPYFSIYELFKFVESMGGKENARAALQIFRDKVKKAGFRDLHLNAVVWGVQILPNEKELKNPAELLDYLSFNSATSYVWIHHVGLDKFPENEYTEVRDRYFSFCDQYVKTIRQPYFPNVTMGWDATPRCSQEVRFANLGYPCMGVIRNNTPGNFRNALQQSRDWADKNLESNRIITINSWNEWTEGSMLEPEREYGYGYLEAIRSVFGKK
jgi:hypothetical protein